MPRKKISEYRAKTILSDALGLPYHGISVDADRPLASQLKRLQPEGRFVVKVDQGVKGRFKQGLVLLDVASSDVPQALESLVAKGYRYLLVEPFAPHEDSAEYYLAIERARAGNMVMFSKLGGINVESQASEIVREHLVPSSSGRIEDTLGLSSGSLDRLAAVFQDNYCSFLEINPLVVTSGVPQFLDAAVEVDDQAAPFVHERWTPADFRELGTKTPEEQAVVELASQSQASFALKVINPDGAFFLLLSGGGASIVMADEVANLGYGAQLANYGEYSGNPNVEETYLYTRQVLSLMLKSNSPRKVLIIGGGVANFTDIRQTLKGVIRALDETKEQLRAQQIKVFVRRGGPHEVEGLAQMEAFLIREGLHGLVAGPELTMSKIIPAAAQSLENTEVN
ncbi:MAG TPA: ATP citrate lyase citrate-binding domain-containing protein [Candidatus Saccharimonadia bacterium]